MPIRLLSEETAARIAAGEVIERPASVVKELVENSLDAAATRIEVETRGGGQAALCIRDDGHGIPAAEVLLAFRRHATSKLETAADLEQIATLGFRGEALASIASVSRLTCTTRSPAEALGTRVRLEGGAVTAQKAIGYPRGTEMLIEDLFYNVPARLKFLRAAATERRHIDAFLTRYAIAYPHVAFAVLHDGKPVLTTPGGGAYDEALMQVYGLEMGGALLAIPAALTEGQPITVRGYVGPTTMHRADRGYITLFINGRWVQDLRLTYAIIEAYHTLLPVKRFPVAFVLVTMPPDEVDVNVHPAKTEVRFRDADAMFRAVQRAVRATVMEGAPLAPHAVLPENTLSVSVDSSPATASDAPPESANVATRIRLAALTPAARQIDFAPTQAPRNEDAEALLSSHPSAPRQRTLPPLRVIGQASTLFIIAEGPDGLYLIDQHAAHERVLYERLTAERGRGQVAMQTLLQPQSVTLPADAAAALADLLPVLPACGLAVEQFGPGTFLVRAIPAALRETSPDELLADLASAALAPLQERMEELIVRHICKRAAVKAGQILAREEMERLVRDLEQTANPRTCPHGRPTIIQLSVEQLARQFGRLG